MKGTMSDLEHHLQRMKKELETNGVTTLYLQRGSRGEVSNFTVLDSDKVTPLDKSEGEGFFQHVPGISAPAKLGAEEVLRIDVRGKLSVAAADHAPLSMPDDVPKSRAKAAK